MRRVWGGLIALALVLALIAGLAVGERRLHMAQAKFSYLLTDITAWVPTVRAMLQRRAAAVQHRDEAAFLADVDGSDPQFVRDERDEFQNLLRLGLSHFELSLTTLTESKVPAAGTAQRRFAAVSSLSVTVHYAIEGVDARPVAIPWLPTIGFTAGRWVITGEVSEPSLLPPGAGGQPWDGGPIEVRRGPHVTVVVSRAHEAIAARLSALAERGLAAAQAFAPGWDGRVLVTAVDDPAVFGSYFHGATATNRDFEAIAEPVYNEVTDWDSTGTYVTSRVFFNPKYLGDPDDVVVNAFAHEFTHAATADVTSAWTPQWLVEGTATYVEHTVQSIDSASVADRLRRIGVPAALPEAGVADAFLTPDEYFLAWLACRMIAERYGPAKLLALYKAIYNLSSPDPDGAFRQTLGLPVAQFTEQWRAYLRKLSA